MSNIWEQPQLHLAKPQKDSYSVLRGVKNFQSKLYLNNICGISFRIYEFENNERNELYDELEETQLIQALDFEVEWFQIAKVNEKKDDIPVAYKDITCNSLEDELIAKTVYNLNGVFSLYNIEDTSKSIMHIITNDISWNIGYISPTLVSLYRTLSIDSSRIYSLLTNELSKSFNCIFKFNREYKTISAYTLDEIGEDTDIVISEQNLLKSWEKNFDKDKIITSMRVIGGTSTSGQVFDIRKVNFGSDTITNYDYFKPRMSVALQTALTNWESAIDTYSTQYDTNIALLKTYNADLNILNNELAEIKTQISAQEDVMNVSLENHKGNPPISTDSDYTNYQNAVNQLVTLTTQKVNKQIDIDNKNSQINSVNSTLDTIGSNVDKSNFFTSELLNELDCFTYVGNDYIDDTFLSTSETTSEQEIEMALELKSNAEKELFIASRPQPEFKATFKNLWSLQDEKDCVISYDIWREKFKLGNTVTIIINDDSWTQLRIIGIELDYDNPENSEITFSSRTRLDNSTFNLGEIQAQASRAYSAVSMNKYSWNQAASQSSSNEEFRTGVLNMTLNKMVSDDNAQVESGSFGIKLRPWNKIENKYENFGMWLNPYRMIFTEDSFLHSNSAFGLLTMPDGSKKMGINTEYLMGKISITENTYIQNESGSYSFDKNGFLATSGIYSVGINLTTPSEIINVKVNGINQFYIDTQTQSLVYKGQMTAGSININSKFLVSNTGVLTAVDGIFTGKITALDGNIGGFTLDITQLTAGTTTKFMRISPYSTTPGTNNYSTSYGAIDLGRTVDGLDTLIHLRSDGYARFGLNSQNGSVKFNYTDTGGTAYSFYTPNFRIESDNGFVTTNYIRSISGQELWVTSTDADLTVGSDNGTAMLYGDYVQINGYNGTPMTYNGDNVITSATNYHGTLYAGSSPLNISAYFSTSGNFVSTSAGDLGTSTNRWDGAWLSAGYSTTSDRNLKNTINPLSDIYYEFFKRLIPVSFKYNDGTSDRLHIGFISQDVETAMQEVGLSSLEFAGFIKAPIYADYDEEQEPIIDSGIVNYMYFLRYEEFIAINTYVIQKQESKLSEQNIKLQELENRILQLELA